MKENLLSLKYQKEIKIPGFFQIYKEIVNEFISLQFFLRKRRKGNEKSSADEQGIDQSVIEVKFGEYVV